MQLPVIYRIEQQFDGTKVEDIPGTVQAELRKLSLPEVKPGQQVAITGGSRGIANIAGVLKAVVEFMQSLGAKPFVFPAMGSHGGATAEGQIGVLAKLGVTEAFIGVPIVSSMAAVEICRTDDGVPVYVDKHALVADHIVVVNRIKSHTKFKGAVESGLMKMMAIGMGKQKGAAYYHKAAVQYTFPKIILDAARKVINGSPILCGIGLVENGYGQTANLVAMKSNEIESREKELLLQSKKLMAKLPFNEIDLLIVDEMGKDISGVGMDPNVTGRNRDLLGGFPHPTRVKRLFVRDLSLKSGGNATGIGLADITTRRLVDRIDYEATYKNCITGISLEKAAIPMHFATDREAIEVALGATGVISFPKSRIVRIKNTLHLQEVEVSEAFENEIQQRLDLKVIDGPRPMAFDNDGNLAPL